MKLIVKVKFPNTVFYSGLQLFIQNRQQYNLFAGNEDINGPFS
jgi:hypothetical protein